MATPKDQDLPYRREAALRPVTAGRRADRLATQLVARLGG
jgi:hypothetical protein